MDGSVDYILTRDGRINDLSDKETFSVKRGASQYTGQRYLANSQSSSQISFNVSPPSESVVIDRHVLLRSRVNFTITIGDAGANPAGLGVGVFAMQYGLRESFQAFPLSKLFNTVSLSVNNTSISVNLQDIMPGLLQMLDKETLQEYNGMTPSYLDQYQSYVDAAGSFNNNPMAGYASGSSYNDKLAPRGCHPLTAVTVRRLIAGVLQDDSLISTGANNHWEIDVSAVFTEPLFISPMLFGDSKFNKSGFLGVNNFNMIFNVDASLKRLWSSGITLGAAVPYTLAFQANAFQNSELLFNFLSLDQTYSAPSKIVTPFMDYPRYITSNNNAPLAPGASSSYSINAIQLDKIPDKFIVFARKPMSGLGPRDPDAFLPITGVSMTFANASGLLSNFTQQQLWEMSRKNGVKQSWYEWSGKAASYSGADPLVVGSYTRTTGGVLVIDPAFDLSLQGPYLSNSSLGQYQIQMDLTLENTFGAAVNPEIVIVTANSGILTTIAGNSSLYTGLLNSQIVMDTIQKSAGKAISQQGEGNRMVGGSVSGGMKTVKYGGAKSGGSNKLSGLSM